MKDIRNYSYGNVKASSSIATKLLWIVVAFLCTSNNHPVTTAAAIPPVPISSGSSSRGIQRQNHIMLIAQRHRGGGSAASTSSSAAKNESPWIDGLKNSLASALAAAFSKTILAPFDTIKTLQQYHTQTAASSATSLSMLEASRIIMNRPNGFLEFYAGLGVAVVGAIPSVSLYFGMYSYFKKKLSASLDNRTLVIAMSAALGNTVASFSRVPYEVLKQKLQTNAYRNTWEALKDIRNIEMIFPKGGIAIQMMRDIPYAVVTLLVYENLQTAWIARTSNREKENDGGISAALNADKAYRDLLLGGIAGGMGSWVTNPLDVIKTRLQTASPEVYNGSIWKCTQDAMREGGPSTFLRGSVPRLMHKVPANACFFLFYEFFKRLFNCSNPDEETKR